MSPIEREEFITAIENLRNEYKIYQRAVRYNNELLESILVEIRNHIQSEKAEEIKRSYPK